MAESVFELLFKYQPLLYERGVLHTRSYDELNLSQPELIRTVHHDYVAAVAQIVGFGPASPDWVPPRLLGVLQHDLFALGAELATPTPREGRRRPSPHLR